METVCIILGLAFTIINYFILADKVDGNRTAIINQAAQIAEIRRSNITIYPDHYPGASIQVNDIQKAIEVLDRLGELKEDEVEK